MTDYLTLIKEQEQQNLGLYGRMDDDIKLLHLDKYVLKDTAGLPVKNVVNVTLNKPAIFAANVISALNATREQVQVDSDDGKIDTKLVEDFITGSIASANERLLRRGEVSMNTFTDTQACIRGRVARRVLVRYENGIPIIDTANWDTRSVTYQMGMDGPKWAAYSTERDKQIIEQEYGVKIAAAAGTVRDVWDKEHEEVWVNNDQVKEQEHPYGICPVILQVVPLGYGNILLDTDRRKYEGESIFFMIRSLVEHLNMWMSVLETLHLKTVKGPMKQTIRGGGDPVDYEDASGMSTITGLDIGEDITTIQFGDAIRSAQLVYNTLEKALQEGSYTDIDIGNVRQPFSAVALLTIGESKDQVHLPRLFVREMLNKLMAEMIIRQVLNPKVIKESTFQIGVAGHKRTFNLSDLQGEYGITFKSFLKSPKTDLARMAVAQQAERYYDPETILSDVLQHEDPKGVMRKRYYYMAEKISPNVLRNRVIMSLAEEAEKGNEQASDELRIMAVEMGVSLDQLMKGEFTQPPLKEEAQPPGETLPLLGQGGQVGGIPRAGIRTANPEEEATD